MARRQHRAAIRGARLARPLRWLLLALAGTGAGMMLGEHVAGNRLGPKEEILREGSGGGYAGLSANPDALNPDAAAAAPCRDCADSYGAAARLRARREERANAGLSEPAAEGPAETWIEPTDDYRYGRRSRPSRKASCPAMTCRRSRT